MAAKDRAFLPRANNERDQVPLATSTFLIGGLPDGDVWRLGEHKLRGASLHGRADLRAEQVAAVGLQLEADSRFCRHVDIVGWSDQKAGRKLQALKLAKGSNAFPSPR